MGEAGIFRGIRAFDDMARAKRDFIPLEGNKVKMYVCGVTVYDACHLGHARTYVAFDVIRRYMEHRGYEVVHVQNFTDIDDKIIRRAKEEGKTEVEVAERWTAEYFRTMDALHVRRAVVYPRATETMPDIIAMIETLIKKGFAYESSGDVFFSVDTFPHYGGLSGAGAAESAPTEAQRELEGGGRKRGTRDFALWKSAKEGEPFWPSPWSHGRPGWHIECSAMIHRHLGAPIDIHGGGRDLLFPHHENEIAQSEAFTGGKFAAYWLHSGFVLLEGEKMAKYSGNVVSPGEVLEKYPPDALRLFFLKSHYRVPINFTLEVIDDARAGLERFRAFFDGVDSTLAQRIEFRAGTAPLHCDYEKRGALIEAAIETTEAKFTEAMNDDFNTPEALAAMYELVRAGNTFNEELSSGGRGLCCEMTRAALRRVKNKVLELGVVLGLFEPEPSAAGADEMKKLAENLINSMLAARKLAREQKNYALSDMIRAELEKSGVTVEDRPTGTTWRFNK